MSLHVNNPQKVGLSLALLVMIILGDIIYIRSIFSSYSYTEKFLKQLHYF